MKIEWFFGENWQRRNEKFARDKKMFGKFGGSEIVI